MLRDLLRQLRRFADHDDHTRSPHASGGRGRYADPHHDHDWDDDDHRYKVKGRKFKRHKLDSRKHKGGSSRKLGKLLSALD